MVLDSDVFLTALSEQPLFRTRLLCKLLQIKQLNNLFSMLVPEFD